MNYTARSNRKDRGRRCKHCPSKNIAPFTFMGSVFDSQRWYCNDCFRFTFFLDIVRKVTRPRDLITW